MPCVCHESVWGSGGIAPVILGGTALVILNLSTRWRYLVTFIALLLYPQDESEWTISEPNGTEKRTSCITECAGPLRVICLKQHPVVDDLFFDSPLHVGCHTINSLPQVCAANCWAVNCQVLLPFSSRMENELVIASSCDSVFKKHCAILAFHVLFFVTWNFICWCILALACHLSSLPFMYCSLKPLSSALPVMNLTDITWWLNTHLIPQDYATCTNEILYQNVCGHTLLVALNLTSVPCLTWRQRIDQSRQKAVCIFWIFYMQLVTGQH